MEEQIKKLAESLIYRMDLTCGNIILANKLSRNCIIDLIKEDRDRNKSAETDEWIESQAMRLYPDFTDEGAWNFTIKKLHCDANLRDMWDELSK